MRSIRLCRRIAGKFFQGCREQNKGRGVYPLEGEKQAFMKLDRSGCCFRAVQCVISIVFLFAAAPAWCDSLPFISSNTSSGPSVPFNAPASIMKPKASESLTASAIPEQLKNLQNLSLEEVINIALEYNPITKAAWRQARAAAGQLNVSRSLYYPSITVNGEFNRYQSDFVGTPIKVLDTTYGLSASVDYLLFNFGGRYSQVQEAKYALLVADLSQNSTIQNMILEVEQAYYQYLGAKAMYDAALKSLEDAKTNLEAAQERNSNGLATIADVLQAKANYSQAQLTVESTNGQIQITQGGLVTAMGIPANIQVSVGSLPEHVNVPEIKKTIDGLMKEAEEHRPDLAAARAQALQAQTHVNTVLASGLPSLVANGTVSRTYLYTPPSNPYYDQWSTGIQLQIPLFNGFSTAYGVFAAKEQAKAARQQLENVKQQVSFQVWSSYYTLKTAQQQLVTSEDFLTSAQQSEEVALGRYREGVGDILSLLNAQTTLASARAQEVQARANWFIAMAQLAYDTGVLTPEYLNQKISVIKGSK